MKSARMLVVCVLSAVGLLVASPGYAQEKSDQTVGQKVDQALGEIREGAQELAGQLRETFEQIRAKVEQLSVAGRVYARVHWDKALSAASISVEVNKEGVATLSGTVASEAAKTKAGELTADTVGVKQVVNRLKVVPTSRP